MRVLTLPQADASAPSARAKALVFADPLSATLLARLHRLAPSNATILVTGETGTGKEIVARHVHELSRRAGQPFVAVNCGALSETLVDSELFGHERGAFTGALASRPGWFEAARGGTLFLDEIGDLPLAMQVKLLRVLQEGEIVRLGARQPTHIDVRVIAATNVNLEAAVEAGRFREDLFYRLSVASVRVPPLRERPRDILPLADHFLGVYRRKLGLASAALAPDAVRQLLDHPWPGNVRELENVVHHALLVCHDGQVSNQDLCLTAPATARRSTDAPATASRPLEEVLHALFEKNVPSLHAHLERTVLTAAYEYCHRNQLQTARLLGISRNIVRARLIHYGVLVGRTRAGAACDQERPGPLLQFSKRGGPSCPSGHSHRNDMHVAGAGATEECDLAAPRARLWGTFPRQTTCA